jgi:hypothetical protein
VTLPAPIGTVTADVNSVKITGISGLPTGLTYVCDISSCTWPGDSEGCFVINGTPTQSGSFTLSVTVVANVEVPIVGATDAPAYDIVYSLTIDPSTTGIQRIEVDEIKVYPVIPNPSIDGANIRFNITDNRDINLTVHNMIGALVMSKQIHSKKGMNNVSLDTDELYPGVYIVTIMDGANSFTERMVIGAQ